jgi:coenzyme F420-reducing hydrogenase alpha subunit
VDELQKLLPDLEWGLEAAVETVRWAAGLDYPEFESDYEFVSLYNTEEYPITEGTVRSSSGLDVPVEAFEGHFREEHVAHSNALHSRRVDGGGSYLVGPLARMNLNFERFTSTTRSLANEIGLSTPVKNPFFSLIARSLEIVHAFDESIQLVRDYEELRSSRGALPGQVSPGEGAHVTEAPRGLIFHRYRVDENGLIAAANIVPPTSQNLRRIEEDLWQYVPGLLSMPLEDATLKCEQLVRCYDPCISCATHFLKLTFEEV